MSEPYTINIHVANGDPKGVRTIEHMNWTGKGIIFPREDWLDVKQNYKLASLGVYILIGDPNEDTLHTLYIGQGGVVQNRIDAHFKEKNFWT